MNNFVQRVMSDETLSASPSAMFEQSYTAHDLIKATVARLSSSILDTRLSSDVIIMCECESEFGRFNTSKTTTACGPFHIIQSHLVNLLLQQYEQIEAKALVREMQSAFRDGKSLTRKAALAYTSVSLSLIQSTNKSAKQLQALYDFPADDMSMFYFSWWLGHAMAKALLLRFNGQDTKLPYAMSATDLDNGFANYKRAFRKVGPDPMAYYRKRLGIEVEKGGDNDLLRQP